MATHRKCQVCKTKSAQVVVPSNKKPVRPVYTCNECSVVAFPNIFYDGPPIFHFRSENGQWYFVFVHHDNLVPYFYPTPKVQIGVYADGEILFKQAGEGEYEECSKIVCKRVVPYRFVTRAR